MRNYFTILLWAIITLSSCTTYRNKPLTIISNHSFSFNIHEDSLKNKLQIVDSIVYQNNTSFVIGRQYKDIKFRSDRINNKIYNTYYFTGEQNTYADIVILYFYKKKLAKIELTTQNPERIDSLLTATEKFYNQKFDKDFRQRLTEKDSLKYGKAFKHYLHKPIYEHGNLSGDNVTVYYIRNLIFQEITLNIINKKVKLPDWCGNRFSLRSLSYYLKFWRFF